MRRLLAAALDAIAFVVAVVYAATAEARIAELETAIRAHLATTTSDVLREVLE